MGYKTLCDASQIFLKESSVFYFFRVGLTGLSIVFTVSVTKNGVRKRFSGFFIGKSSRDEPIYDQEFINYRLQM